MKVGHAMTDILSKLNAFLDVDLDHCDPADTITHARHQSYCFKQLTCIWIVQNVVE